jgi:hypothetical protein
MGITDLQDGADAKKGIWEKPGWWFWAAIALGLIIRIYLVGFTEGTYDVSIWQNQAQGIHKEGLINHYHTTQQTIQPMNHPPFICLLVSWLWDISQATGIAFRILFRAPFALLDFGSTLLLLQLFKNSRYRFLIGVCYWLHPLAMIFSAYHGNTDSSIAFFLLLCVWLLSKDKIIWAAAAMGVSLWVKLPGVMAIPAFMFYLPNWRKRTMFLGAAGLVGISTYLPALFKDAAVVFENVFGYRSQLIQTTAGIPIWGTRIFLAYFVLSMPPEIQEILSGPLLYLVFKSQYIAIVLIIIFSWLRREKRTIGDLGLTITGVYTILYGVSNFWSFQYFAWSIPLWFFASPGFFITASVLSSAYIYSFYSYVCDSYLLRGKWDFIGHPNWPYIVVFFRDFTVLFFFISACIFLWRAFKGAYISTAPADKESK